MTMLPTNPLTLLQNADQAAEDCARVTTRELTHQAIVDTFCGTKARAIIAGKLFQIDIGADAFEFTVGDPSTNYRTMILQSANLNDFMDALCKLGELLAEAIPAIYNWRGNHVPLRIQLSGWREYVNTMNAIEEKRREAERSRFPNLTGAELRRAEEQQKQLEAERETREAERQVRLAVLKHE